MRPQHDSELEMELIPRQTSIGIDSSSSISTPSTSSTSTKASIYFSSMNEFSSNLYGYINQYCFCFLESSYTVWFIPLIFALATFYMYILSTNAPPLTEENDR